MIRLIEAHNYRCLRYVKQPLSDFHVLVGPNASGKTTFLDVVSFLGDLVGSGLEAAIEQRASTFSDLLFGHMGGRFELAVELEIPEEKRQLLPKDRTFRVVRYEIAIGLVEEADEIQIVDEKVLLLENVSKSAPQRVLFPSPQSPPPSMMTAKLSRNRRRVVSKVHGGNDNYNSEVHKEGGKGWAPSIRLGPRKSALANLPEDEKNFPVSTWLRSILRDGVQKIVLNSQAMRKTSAPGHGMKFRPDGSNLPWVIDSLKLEEPDRHAEWVRHVQTALPDLKDIQVVELPDTRHKYVRLVYDTGLQVPAWMASDGTMRLLALTLPAYLPKFSGVYLIEEPENGIHPMAMETVFQSLHSVYSAQILLATHSPVVLGLAGLRDVLCFKKDTEGATDIVLGNEHPKLKNWQTGVRLSDLYASGVLG